MLFAEFTFFETTNPLSYQVQQDKFEVGCSVIKPHCFMLTIILIPPRLQIGGLRVTSLYFCCTDSNTQREEIHALPLLGSQTDRITNSNSLASIKTQTLLFKLGLITRGSHQASFRSPMIRNLNRKFVDYQNVYFSIDLFRTDLPLLSEDALVLVLTNIKIYHNQF